MKRIVMIGSSRATRGGISSMVNVYFAAGLFDRWDAEYLETHCDGSKARKLAKAAGAWLAFMDRLLSGAVALLHVHIASDASFWRKALFIAPAHALGVPYVLHMHGGDFERFYRERCGPFARRVLRFLYSRAQSVIALTDGWKRAIEAVVPEARVTVIPNPVEVPRVPAPVATNEPRVTYLGVVKEAKGVYELLEAFGDVARLRPAARLVVAGSGEIEKLRYKACERDLYEAIETPGWVGPTDKAALLQRASVFVLPSHFEALPMALLEAMAAGVPVIATRVGGIPDVVSDGRDGLLVEPRDPAALSAAIGALLDDPGERARLGRAARRRVSESFSVEAVLPQVEALWAAHAAYAKRTSEAGAAFP
jgi:glycosyltransferase involved in cell wall biosynthesis